MLILITYDVNTENGEGRKRLNKIARICCNYGQRVQNSVFECALNSTQLIMVRNMLLQEIDANNDSLRIYNLGKDYSSKIEQYGFKKSYYPEEELIF